MAPLLKEISRRIMLPFSLAIITFCQEESMLELHEVLSRYVVNHAGG
jgi:hypothetical protein